MLLFRPKGKQISTDFYVTMTSLSDFHHFRQIFPNFLERERYHIKRDHSKYFSVPEWSLIVGLYTKDLFPSIAMQDFTDSSTLLLHRTMARYPLC